MTSIDLEPDRHEPHDHHSADEPVARLVHPRAIRWFHWINVPLLTIMVWSGLRIYWAEDVYAAATRADAVVLATEWPEFRLIDPEGLRRVMRGDLIIDGRNCLPEANFHGSGLKLVGFGW